MFHLSQLFTEYRIELKNFETTFTVTAAVFISLHWGRSSFFFPELVITSDDENHHGMVWNDIDFMPIARMFGLNDCICDNLSCFYCGHIYVHIFTTTTN